MTYPPEQIKEWAERLWPCSFSDHEEELKMEGWCGACGRLAPGATFSVDEDAEGVAKWEHDGFTIAIVASARLQVRQGLYEAAIEG